MLYRKQLITLLLGFSTLAHATDPFEQATQSSQARHKETATILEQADALGRSSSFIEQIEREAKQAVESGEAYLATPQPTLPQPSPEILDQTRNDLARLLNQDLTSTPLADVAKTSAGPQLYLFVSFAMPEQSLKKLLRQSASINATLVLRGFINGSLTETKNSIAKILESDAQGHTAIDVGFAIDPTLFDRFMVNTVPTFVLTEAAAERCTEQSCPIPTHARLSGDVTLSYVLETMAREAPVMRSQAQAMIDRLRSGG